MLVRRDTPVRRQGDFESNFCPRPAGADSDLPGHLKGSSSRPPHQTVRVRTGIAVEARHPGTGAPLGLLVRDRSSMAARGLATTAGVIDTGYRGEVLIVMTNLGETPVELKPGDKIAQMIPVPVLTGHVHEMETLEASAREAKGFGSSGI